MRKIIVGMDGCPKCKRLAELNPDAEYIEANQELLMSIARATGYTSLPFVVSVGEPQELADIIK